MTRRRKYARRVAGRRVKPDRDPYVAPQPPRVHHTVEAFDADERHGVVLVDADGRVVQRKG
jgi:hypothetical protein